MTAVPPISRPAPAAAVVWAGWLVATLAAFALVGRYGGRAPYMDDFAYFGLNVNGEHAGPADLWVPMNEHRVPVPKFVTWAVCRWRGFDLPAVMRVNVAVTAAAAAGLIAAARAARGGVTRPADVFLPLLLLSPAHAENFLWAVQVNFLVPAAAVAGLLAAAVTCGPGLTAGRAATAGGLAVTAGLSGVQGQVPAAAAAGWLLLAGGLWPAGRPAAAAAWLGGLAAFAAVGVCLAGYNRSADIPAPELGWPAVRYAVRVLGSGWGPVVERVGPAEPCPIPACLGMATLGLVAVVGWWAVRAARDPQNRAAAVGSLAMLVGLTAVCAAVGVARGPMNGWKLADRYTVLAAPVLAWAYLAAVRFGPPGPARWVTAGMLATAGGLLWANADLGLRYAHDRAARQARVDADAVRGVPPSFFVDHHGADLFPPDPAEAAVVFEALRVKRIGPYHRIRPEPAVEAVGAAWSLVGTPAAGPDGWVEVAAGDVWRAELRAALPAAAVGLAVRYSAACPGAAVASEVWWADPAGGRPAVAGFFAPGDGRVKRVWLGSPVGKLDLRAGGPARVRVEAVTALVATDRRP